MLAAMTTTVAQLVVLLLALASPAPAPTPIAPPGTARQAPTPGVWPLQPTPTVVAEFEPPPSRYGAGHRGVDLAGHAGQVVRAAAGGRVTFAGALAGRGVVVVSHGGTRTTYEPVRASVAVGATVVAAQPIGTLEVVGSHCAPEACLHWGLLDGERYLDPLTLVGAGPVRLLPLAGMPAVQSRRTVPAGAVSFLGPRGAGPSTRTVAPPGDPPGRPPGHPRPV